MSQLLFRIRQNSLIILLILIDLLPGFIVRTGWYVSWRRRFSTTPQRFDNYHSATEWSGRKFASSQTDLVIEGFPGSGNSFVSNCLRAVVSDTVTIESHFHWSAQIKRAMALDVPIIVVVRDPFAACSSLKSKEPALFDWVIICYWLYYHYFVYRAHASLALFRFSDLIDDIDLLRVKHVAVQHLVDGHIVADLAYQRQSENRRQINTRPILASVLMSRANRRYHLLCQVAVQKPE